MSVVDRLLFAALAIMWSLLGWSSRTDSVIPWAGTGFWLAGCTVVAGTAIAVVRYQSQFALRAYLTAVVGIAAARSIAYLTVERWTPLEVWIIVALSSTLVFEKLRRKLPLHYHHEAE